MNVIHTFVEEPISILLKHALEVWSMLYLLTIMPYIETQKALT